MRGKINSVLKNGKIIYFFLGLILLLGLFLRVYNIGNTLGFYYDQGRDALVIWDLWHKGNFFLIGPTTGIAGIFRGPYYYYLIAPFYLLGKGNPVWPSVFLSATTVFACFLAYHLGAKMHSRVAGLIAALISAYSFNMVMASRWLSNPTPMLVLSLILVWAILRKSWPIMALVAGLSLFHFGSAGEVFYLLAILIFVFWERKNLPNRKTLLICLGIFFLTVLPLIIFDFKNHFLLTNNIKKFLIIERSFRPVTWRVVQDKINMYADVFGKLVFHGLWEKEKIFLNIAFFWIIYSLPKLARLKGVKILLLLLATAGVGLIFFQGNEGNFYDYYLTGFFLIFILLFAIGLAEICLPTGKAGQSWFGKIFVAYFLYLFLVNNYAPLKFKLTDKVDGPGSIALKSELSAVGWVFADAGESKFNVDIYVPPVIPYAYDYLFLWKNNGNKIEETQPLLYTLYENDNSNQGRLPAWLARQKGIGRVEKEIKFGGITVQRRSRI